MTGQQSQVICSDFGITIEVTQQVINDQMRAVQEIASMLGETTAKSKVALLKLQKVINGEENV